ncbi:unnamed protein product [Spirodela intermedia]|uniref:Exostosin GT47 domain-containing protein n=1 Tax=Spirodela intermedia TaxID=51605 RepID=A0A7I8IKU3_SPIIN|nr:unnamed protein product [Spirodela intermedia]CAA6658483.1 unnamed protein product [Spirodela intermedia]
MRRLTRFSREATRCFFHVAPVALVFSSIVVFLVYAPATTLHLRQLNSDADPLQDPSPPPVNGSLSSTVLAAPPPSSPAEVEGIPVRAAVDPRAGGGRVKKSSVFLDGDLFLEDYQEMNRSLKIFVYPHRRNESFAHALLPGYFFKTLVRSHFITDDPSEADFFFLPFSITALRNDPKVSVGGIPDFVQRYVSEIRRRYPFWDSSGGADHFYVACHSTGRSAMSKTPEVTVNAIQVVCSASYFLPGYVAHKDVSMPQIWPRKGAPPEVRSTQRSKLAFFAGAMNSRVRQQLLVSWVNDSEIFVNRGRLPTPYSEALLSSKFCLHAKGFEVNTARIGDAVFYGCVPVVLADQYELPFSDILDWRRFAVVVATHFQWHLPARDYDVFHMVMYELWRRRGAVSLPLPATAADA